MHSNEESGENILHISIWHLENHPQFWGGVGKFQTLWNCTIKFQINVKRKPSPAPCPHYASIPPCKQDINNETNTDKKNDAAACLQQWNLIGQEDRAVHCITMKLLSKGWCWEPLLFPYAYASPHSPWNFLKFAPASITGIQQLYTNLLMKHSR